MAGREMTSTEIWLRLIYTGDLYGDPMLNTAQYLAQSGTVDIDTLIQSGLTIKQAGRFFAMSEQEVDDSLNWLEQPEHHLVLASDRHYPQALRSIVDYPGAIFVKGEPAILNHLQLAVVGSRATSWYGERWGRYFCEALAQSGLTITSGLALGIDSVAHRATLNVKGKTVGVLGNGLYSPYPRRHRALASQIVELGGALVSEFALNVTPYPANFPRRNRIISGLSRGVLVVEAALRSGSLVTARCALDQGREVFALPGPLGSPGSEGPHWLIQQGALLVTSPEEILENLPALIKDLPDGNQNSNYSSDQHEAALPFPELLANVGDEVTPVDVVAEPGGYVRLRRASHVRRTNVFV